MKPQGEWPSQRIERLTAERDRAEERFRHLKDEKDASEASDWRRRASDMETRAVQAEAQRDRLAEVAEELAEALSGTVELASVGESLSHQGRKRAEKALAHYKSLKGENK